MASRAKSGEVVVLQEKINKTFVEKKQTDHKAAGVTGKYKDPMLKGFGVKVYPSGKAVYILESKVNGKPFTNTLGVHGEITADQARALATERKVQAKKEGGTPNDIKAEERAARERCEQALRARTELTLGRALDEYLAAKKLKESSVKNYRCVVTSKLSDWLDKPLVEITKDMIANRHRDISDKHPGEADNVMRVVRALFTFAGYKYEDESGNPLIGSNPVRVLSQQKQWNKPDRRETFIGAKDLGLWYNAVVNLDNTTFADYFLFLLFTGLRRDEAACLRWEHVNLIDKQFTLPKSVTKNKQPLRLPLSDFLHQLLLKRWDDPNRDQKWVFPGEGKGKTDRNGKADTDDAGHIAHPYAQVAKVIETSGVEFTVHDLRRTFTTIADGLGIGHYTIKKLINHKTTDVTGGYFAAGVDELREPMQQITNILKEHMGVKTRSKPKKSKVADLAKARSNQSKSR